MCGGAETFLRELCDDLELDADLWGVVFNVADVQWDYDDFHGFTVGGGDPDLNLKPLQHELRHQANIGAIDQFGPEMRLYWEPASVSNQDTIDILNKYANELI